MWNVRHSGDGLLIHGFFGNHQRHARAGLLQLARHRHAGEKMAAGSATRNGHVGCHQGASGKSSCGS